MVGQNQRILCLDVGTKTCGIAATDPLGITVQPITTIRYKGLQDLQTVQSELLKFFLELEPYKIVVGLPYNMDDSEGTQAKLVKEFVNSFKTFLKNNKVSPNDYEWDFWDERLTSEEADSFLREHKVNRKKRKEVLDKMAAVFILQRYLTENH